MTGSEALQGFVDSGIGVAPVECLGSGREHGDLAGAGGQGVLQALQVGHQHRITDPGRRRMPASTCAASASCGTQRGLTKLVASTVSRPVAAVFDQLDLDQPAPPAFHSAGRRADRLQQGVRSLDSSAGAGQDGAPGAVRCGAGMAVDGRGCAHATAIAAAGTLGWLELRPRRRATMDRWRPRVGDGAAVRAPAQGRRAGRSYHRRLWQSPCPPG